MSILNETYQVCKNIIRHPIRNEVKSLIKLLNTSSASNPNDKSDRSEFGYLARNRNLEFLGYLVTHIQSDEIKKIIPVINFNPLNDSEVELFEKAHNFIIQTNKKCLKKLLASFPNAELALDNYSGFPYNFKKQPIEELADLDESIKNLVNAFELHPSYLFIKENIGKFSKIVNIPKNHLLMTISAYSRDFLKSEPKMLSSEASQIWELSRQKNEQADLLRITFSLFCLRLSLKNIDKFLYLSFFKDKLPVLNNENVFNIKTHHKNMLGDFLILENQPTGSELFATPSEPILVKLDLNNHTIDSPYYIQGISTSIMSEYGDKQEFDLRKIDEHMNIVNSFYYR